MGLGHGKKVALKGGSPPGLLLEYTSLALTNKQCSLISKKAVSCHNNISYHASNPTSQKNPQVSMSLLREISFFTKNLTAIQVRPLRASWLLLMQSMHAFFPGMVPELTYRPNIFSTLLFSSVVHGLFTTKPEKMKL